MINKIDHISFKDIFWVQFKSHLISFGFKGLPDSTHFTIGFDKRSPDINFHVTKNTINPKDKPQIKIVIINKELLKEEFPSLILSVFNKILKPFDIEELRVKYGYNLRFISFNNLQNTELSSLIEKHLIEIFKETSKIRKKTRLKVEGDIENRIVSFSTSENLQQIILDNNVELSDKFEKYNGGGIILTEDSMLQVITINEKWFTIRTDVKPFDILCEFVDPLLAKQLVWRTKRALVAIKKAEKYLDTKYLYSPIRLVRQT